MELKQLNFSKTLFNPLIKGFDDEMIKRSKVFDMGDPRILTYIILVYDLQSEYRRNIKEYLRRKTEAGMSAGFKMKDGIFDRKIEDMMVGESEQFNKAVIEYVSWMHERNYKHLVVLEFNYHKLAIESMKTWDKKRMDLMTEMKDEMEKIELVLFGGEEVQNMRLALYAGTERTKLRIRKEDELEEFELNGLRDWSPYGDYIPQKLKFVGDYIP
jgi:hypothetical protein